MRGKENRLAFGLQFFNQIAHFAPPHRVQPRHRLVQKNHFGVMQDRLRNPRPLQHALGKFPQLHIRRVLQSHPRQYSLHSGRELFRIHARKMPVILQQLARREVVVKIWLFRKEPDLRLHLGIIQLHP